MDGLGFVLVVSIVVTLICWQVLGFWSAGLAFLVLVRQCVIGFWVLGQFGLEVLWVCSGLVFDASVLCLESWYLGGNVLFKSYHAIQRRKGSNPRSPDFVW